MSIEEAIYIGNKQEKQMDIETARNLYLKGEIKLKNTFICSVKECKGPISCCAFNEGSKKKYHFAAHGEHKCKSQLGTVNKLIESDAKINTESKVDNRSIVFEPDFQSKVKPKVVNVSSNESSVKKVTYKNVKSGEEKPYKHNSKYTAIKSLVNLFINDKEIKIKVANKIFKITDFVVELNYKNIMTELINNNSTVNIKNIYNKIFYLKGKIIETNDSYVIFSSEEMIYEGEQKKISIYIDRKVLNKKVYSNKEYTFYCCEDIKINPGFFTIFINNPNKIYVK